MAQKKKITWEITWTASAPPPTTEPSDNNNNDNNNKNLSVGAIIGAGIGGVSLIIGIVAAAVVFTKRRSGNCLL